MPPTVTAAAGAPERSLERSLEPAGEPALEPTAREARVGAGTDAGTDVGAGAAADRATADVLRAALAERARRSALTAGPPLPWSPLTRALDAFHASRRVALVALADVVLAALGALVGGAAPRAAVGTAALVVVVGNLTGLYGHRDAPQTMGVGWYVPAVLPAVGATAVVGALLAHRDGSAVVAGALAAGAALVLARGLAWWLLSQARLAGRGLRSTLLVGGGREAQVLWHKLRQFPEAGLAPVAVLDAAVLHEPGGLSREVVQRRAEHVVLLPSHADEAALALSLRRFDGLPTTLSLVPPFAEVFLGGRVSEVGGVPLVPLGRALHGRSAFPGKRLADVVLSALLLLLASPLIAVAALAVRREDGGPAFFRQARTGRHGRVFHMVKLRSMSVDAEQRKDELRAVNVTDGLLFKVADDPRVTRVGRVIRATSIDELPQLWNVLRGDMSLVGPRPLPNRPDEFSQEEAGRHHVRPGITGYWQISGGNGLSYDEMVRLDLAYVHSWSLWLDLRLLLRTPTAMLRRKAPA